MSAAAELLKSEASVNRILHVAHSVGGHFVGLVANQEIFERQAFFAVGSGFLGYHRLWYVPLLMYFWWIYGPVQLTLHGYIKTGGGWRGTPLPPEVFRTWRTWCHRKTYFREDLHTKLQPNWYNDVKAPIRAWVFSDDPVSTVPATQDMMLNYPKAEAKVTLHKPSDFGVKSIGHAGAFQKHQTKLWADVLNWLTA